MAQFLFDILIRATDLVLVAVGLSAVYSLVKFPNVAIVQYATLAAFVTLAFQAIGVPLALAILLATLLLGAVAVALNILIFERMLRTGSAFALIGSLAVSMLFSAILLVTAGAPSRRFDLEIKPPLIILGSRITENQLVALAISIVVLVIFALLLFRTDIGRCMRAVSSNVVLARATGIDTRLVTNIAVFLSGAMTALGGITLSLKGELNIQLGTDLLLPVFAAAVLGGLGNPLGAILGALMIATAETVVTNTNFGPLTGESYLFLPAAYASAASFAILVVTLLLRPYGLFVGEVKRV